MNILNHPEYFYQIRHLIQTEEEFLKEMLYEAIYLPPPLKKKLSKDVIFHPELSIYFENWGRPGDIAIVAENTDAKRLLGCAWGRLYIAHKKGYGFVSEGIPEISVAVVEGFKNQGIGTKLIRRILQEYINAGFNVLSLSVSKENRSVGLYLREGFQIIEENDNDYIMIYDRSKSEY